MGVDQAGADAAVPWSGRDRRRGLGRQRPEVGADRRWPRSGRAPRRRRSSRPIAREEVLLPARPLVRQIGPFAGDGAVRAREAAEARARSGSRRGRRTPRAPSSRGRCRFSHISFGVSISGDMTPPTKSSTRWPVGVAFARPRPTARWSSQTMMSQRVLARGRDATGAAAAVEHDERAGGVEADAAHRVGAAPAWPWRRARRWRRRRARCRRVDCSAMIRARGRFIRIGCSPRPAAARWRRRRRHGRCRCRRRPPSPAVPHAASLTWLRAVNSGGVRA